MNYLTFLNQTDELLQNCDATTLRSIVHELARMVPETERPAFLKTLKDFRRDSEDVPEEEPESNETLREEIDDVIAALEELNEGDRTLKSELNEEWDDWYGGPGKEFIYSDPENLTEDVERAVRLIHECVDQAEYEKGEELTEALSEMRIDVRGEYENTSMDLRELSYNELIDIDYEKTIREALILACMGSEKSERAVNLYYVMKNFDCRSVTLEEILTTVPEEIDLISFLPDWIDTLAEYPARETDTLLEEAFGMIEDETVLLETASRNAEEHPALYRNILRDHRIRKNSEEMMRIGLRALKEVPEENPKRSEISLFTAKYALDAKDRKTAEDCWMEAFRSAPTVVNYLRLRNEAESFEPYAESAHDIYESFYSSKDRWDKKPLYALMFFDERFDGMMEAGMESHDRFSWSGTFLKEGISLLLSLLYEEKEDGPGMSAMRELAKSACSFNGTVYCVGTDLVPDQDDMEFFRKCFERWKASVSLQEMECARWLGRIDQWIERLTADVMSQNRRKSYGECAIFIAALGEVLESRGEPGGKKTLMDHYRDKYHRRWAFHQELSDVE